VEYKQTGMGNVFIAQGHSNYEPVGASVPSIEIYFQQGQDWRTAVDGAVASIVIWLIGVIVNCRPWAGTKMIFKPNYTTYSLTRTNFCMHARLTVFLVDSERVLPNRDKGNRGI
jgi:hypothetical protein